MGTTSPLRLVGARNDYRILVVNLAGSSGVSNTPTPARWRAAILFSAVPAAIGAAWPVRLPSGAVRPHPPSPVSIGQVGQVETICQHYSHHIFGEWVSTAIAGGAVASEVESSLHLFVALALACHLEGQEQAGVSGRVRGWCATLPLWDTERQQASF